MALFIQYQDGVILWHPHRKKIDSKRVEALYNTLKATVSELAYLGDSENNIINVVQSAISHSASQGGNKE